MKLTTAASLCARYLPSLEKLLLRYGQTDEGLPENQFPLEEKDNRQLTTRFLLLPTLLSTTKGRCLEHWKEEAGIEMSLVVVFIFWKLLLPSAVHILLEAIS